MKLYSLDCWAMSFRRHNAYPSESDSQQMQKTLQNKKVIAALGQLSSTSTCQLTKAG